jgi:recombination protein RecA
MNMSQALRKLTGAIHKSNAIVIFINQMRQKIGTFFGNPETTTGGNALKYYATVRIDVRKTNPIKEGDTIVGSRVKVKVVKNKLAPPFREAEFDILYGEGISKEGEIIDIGVENEVIEKSGAWFSYKGERLAQGRDNLRKVLKENEKLRKEIESAIIEKLGLRRGNGTK